MNRDFFLKPRYLSAFLWGISEAMFFFIVPDVWLTIIYRIKRTNIIYATIVTTIGALIGGAIMFYMGKYFPEKTWFFLTEIPGISGQLLIQVENQMQETGLLALVLGPFKGIPYKIFAVNSARVEYNLYLFILVSIPARCFRFIFSIFITKMVFKFLERNHEISEKSSIKILAGFWVIFYTFYFYIF
ncbi:MAG: hypothetical protein ACD_79C00174G0001 [uncultured bacterium]|nr:MAG: hypothetical protein ACD_79C00174G0001 [uncultured bacterium]